MDTCFGCKHLTFYDPTNKNGIWQCPIRGVVGSIYDRMLILPERCEEWVYWP